MKTKYLFIIFLICLVGGNLSCTKTETLKQGQYYTCPMHPQIKQDNPGQCPICGMDLVLVDANSNEVKDANQREVRIDPSYVQNIGIKFEKVIPRNLIKVINTYGKVAHDANLWIAQNEYIQALKLGDQSLIRSSELKLEYMGLSKEWVQNLKSSRIPDLTLHLESKTGANYFEAFIYQEDIPLIQNGQSVDILDQNGRFLDYGEIKAIGTMVNLDTRSVRVLIQSNNKLNLKLNTFVQFKIHFPLGEKLSVSKEAVLFNGDHNLVYVVKDSEYYIPTIVELGELAGDYYEVKSGLQEGNLVVTNGTFLIDSETQIKLGDSHQGHEHE